ncbi:MAG: hypothetical protein LAQ30_21910 [Acidobacteriia bacterium]|nr:hypothetical protein [Terriglobia bacterium]
MTTTAIVIIIIAAIIVAAALTWYFLRQRRSRTLQSQFGPEYEHAIRQYGDAPKAEAALRARQRRMEKLHIRPLLPEERERFGQLWHDVQARFVDNPESSIHDADNLVSEAMRARGYPMADFERRAEDISVDHPQVVRNYRAAHAIAVRREKGEASTEDLRQALVYYRDLFDELLEAHTGVRR